VSDQPAIPDKQDIAARVRNAVFALNEAMEDANDADLMVEITENTIARVGRRFRLRHLAVNVMEQIG
jgi:hypothetical protein